MTSPNQKMAILEKVCSQIPFPLLTSMYEGCYKWTLNKYREILGLVIQKNNANPLIATLNNKDIDEYLLWKVKTQYHPVIISNTEKIASIPIVEQKSPEWFKLREGMISASDAGYFLKKCGPGRAMDTLKIKIGVKN